MWADSAKNSQAHAWHPGGVLELGHGDLPEGHVGAEIPGRRLPDRHAGVTPQKDSPAVPEHVRCNICIQGQVTL